MKKLFLLMSMLVLVIYVAGSEIKNKGSSQSLNASNINALIPENIDQTAETTYWFVQQNSSNNCMVFEAVPVNVNLQNLRWKDARSKSTQKSSSLFMNSSNTLRSISTDMVMVQWRTTMNVNNNSYGFTSTLLVALKIWPTSTVYNNVVAVDVGRSIEFNSYNSSSSFSAET
jgi:hypothetical protein